MWVTTSPLGEGAAASDSGKISSGQGFADRLSTILPLPKHVFSGVRPSSGAASASSSAVWSVLRMGLLLSSLRPRAAVRWKLAIELSNNYQKLRCTRGADERAERSSPPK